MVRRMCFIDQPRSTISTASQSSNSGCVGRSPIAPKSPIVRTSPTPKTSAHQRLTVTREVNGFAGSTIHRASPSRLAGESSVGT